MNIFKLIRSIYHQKNTHFISVPYTVWQKWGIILTLIVVLFKKDYKKCVIHRKKYKNLTDFVVIALKWSGKNVKRRTSGFAKEFLKTHPNATCLYCDTPLTDENATTDHIVPISEGGNNTQVNMVVTCFKCNNERGNILFREYLITKNSNHKNILFI